MLKTTGRILLIVIMFSGMIGTVIPQKTKQPKGDPFAIVPAGRRERLKYRLAEFIEYQRKKQWDKVFDMLADHFKKSGTTILTKEDFLKKRLYNRVSKFTPTGAMGSIDGSEGFELFGCGRFGFEDNYEAALEAYYVNGDWYFSTINAIFS